MKGTIVTVAVVLALLAATIWFGTRIPASPFDGATADTSSGPDLVSKGEYVARTADCVACHSLPDAPPFSGGLKMGTPIGAIYTTNITPDDKHGIGRYSLADFERAVRQGVAADGHRLYPAMPYPSYAKLSDDDVRALYAYFKHGVDAAAVPNKPSDIPPPLNVRWPVAMWNLAFAPNESFKADPGKSETWNRGAYLVQGPGHCGSCHTPRGIAFNEKAMDQSDKAYLAGALLDGWYAPSLRQDVNTGLGRWSNADVHSYLKTGRNQYAVVAGSMTDAFNNSTQFMTDDDLHAIADYLKSLPGDPSRDGSPWRYDDSTLAKLAPDNLASDPTATLYAEKCGFCHGLDGKGKTPWISPLAGAASSLASEAASQINITLNGSPRVIADGMPDSYHMPPYRAQLSDDEIASVLSFIRSAWGNDGGAVTASAVSDLRKDTDPASTEVVVLQMR